MISFYDSDKNVVVPKTILKYFKKSHFKSHSAWCLFQLAAVDNHFPLLYYSINCPVKINKLRI